MTHPAMWPHRGCHDETMAMCAHRGCVHNGDVAVKHRVCAHKALVQLTNTRRHEIVRVAEKYDKDIASYSNPALIEIQLQVISEFVESLVRFSGCHKWDAEASQTVEKYHTSIGELLQKARHAGEGPQERNGLPAGGREGRRRQGKRGRPAARFSGVKSIHRRGEVVVSRSDGAGQRVWAARLRAFPRTRSPAPTGT